MTHRPGTDFGPTWPEVLRLVPRHRKKEQKSTCAGMPPQGVRQKMGAVFTHDYFCSFFANQAVS